MATRKKQLVFIKPSNYNRISVLKTIEVKWRYGKIDLFCEDKLISNSILHYGEWAQKEIEFISELLELEKGSNIIFGGANVGIQSIAIANMIDESNTIYSFEIHPQIFELLDRNVANSNCLNIRATNQGLSNSKETIFVPRIESLNLDNIGAFSISNVDLKGELAAELISIDELKLDDCSFIHLDIEGHEISCIKGAINTIKSFHPDIYAEITTSRRGQSLYNKLVSYYTNVYIHCPKAFNKGNYKGCLLYTSPSPRDRTRSRMPSSA